MRRDHQNAAQRNAYYFEGSISDLVAELEEILTPEQVAELVAFLLSSLNSTIQRTLGRIGKAG